MSSKISRVSLQFVVVLGIAILVASLSGTKILGSARPFIQGQAEAATDLILYADALADGWADWSWSSTRVFDNDAPIQSGAASIALTYSAAWAGFSLRTDTPIAGAGYTAVDFWAYGGVGGSQIILYLQSSDDGAALPGKALTAPAGTWTHFTVLLSELGSPTQIARITWQDGSGGAQPTYYLDNIRLIAVNSPPVALPDAVADAVRSGLDHPTGIAIAPGGRVFVAIWGNDNADGQGYRQGSIQSWPSVATFFAGNAPDIVLGQSGAAQISNPEALTVDAAGRLYVADTYNHRVWVFNSVTTNGQQPDILFGTQGDSNQLENKFQFTRGLAVDSAGHLFVTDEFNNRVVVYQTPIASNNPTPIRQFSGLFGPRAVAVDGNDRIYIADSQNAQVKVFDQPFADNDFTTPDRTFGQQHVSNCASTGATTSATTLSCPIDVAVDSSGNLFISDTPNHRVLGYVAGESAPTTVYGQADFGGYLSNRGGAAGNNTLSEPLGMAFDGTGALILADFGNGRVLKFDAAAAPTPTATATATTSVATPTSTATATATTSAATSTSTPTATATTSAATSTSTATATGTAGAATSTSTPTASSTPTIPANVDVALSVDVQGDRKPISPLIYGMNTYQMPGDVQAYMQALGLTVRRWGGNASSRYNWKLDVSNTAMDWYFENFKESDAVNLPDDSGVNRYIDQNSGGGVDSFLTLPMIGYTAKDAVSCSYSIARYGAQQDNDWQWRPDCGNGILSNGQPVPDPSALDTSIAITTSWVSDWVGYLTGRYGDAANGGIRFYNLDNEPDLWWETHRDVQPIGWKYQEFRDLSQQYAASIRAADPTAQILGPVVNGWTYYWHGAYDAQRQDWASPDDRNANGGTPFVPWYLQQMKAYEETHSVRLLDYLDLHYYPQAGGVSLSQAGDAATQARRLRSTRSLWDPTYVDESWIASAGPDGGIVRLIPRMREWVDNNYPNTKLAIGEYNWGGLEHINGALAQADVLGIFGREGMDLATLWQPPALNDPGAFAFRLYRNYDGTGAKFGDVSVHAESSDQARLSIYAAQRSADNALTLIIINKTGAALAADLSISNFPSLPSAQVYRYSAANLAAIVHLEDQPIAGNVITAVFPANSITLLLARPVGTPDGSHTIFLPSVVRNP